MDIGSGIPPSEMHGLDVTARSLLPSFTVLVIVQFASFPGEKGEVQTGFLFGSILVRPSALLRTMKGHDTDYT